MPFKSPEDRRANWFKDHEKRKARSREYYRKHRAKRLAAKRAEYADDPEKLRERNRQQYAKNRDARVAYAKEYRLRNREAILAKKAAEWRENKDEIKSRRKSYSIDLENRRAYQREWQKRNPDKAALYYAKSLIAEQTGLAARDIPDDIALAKLEQLEITRWVREQSSASADARPKGGDGTEIAEADDAERS
jgi:hypothetical protein